MSHTAHAEDSPFASSEVEALHQADRKAAKAIILLMVSIFATGIVLYTIVAWACTSA